MKILIVTSEVTFVPENYNLFLEGLFKELANESDILLELVILKNNSPALTIKGLALTLIGAKHIGFHLMKNTIKALFHDRKELAKKYKIKTHYFKNPNTAEFREFVKNYDTDLLVNARTRYIYKNKTLKIPKIAAINIHHGLLPDFRGTMCDLWALKADRPTGFTIHIMDKKIDNGAIIKTVETSILGNPLRSNFATLIKESSRIEGIEMAKIILSLNKNPTVPIQSDNVSLNPVYTKNPNFLDIRKFLQKGVEL
jgi:methionyl-tRNA formyltransferase